MERDLIRLGERRRDLQNLPIGAPDPVPNRTWVKRREHGRITERALIASEIGERQERRQHQAERQEQRYQEALDRPHKRPQEAFMHTFRFTPSGVQNVVQAPQRHRPPPITIENTREEEVADVPETPPPSTLTRLTRLVPQTPERPRPRRSPSPEDSPELALPPSTAPPAIGGGRGKRVRKRTTRLVEARQQGFLPDSQDN
ncbi:uncharacterized protein PV07_04790 [Cladophialophora immunda]|uniref:Uncharacterized protein n=1 Tax=Cladophialophora immunda TaxID=569365 RepID=A0A0D2CCY0_9EURO|nr:uncharacterized protein PV07_04790 [Cladophialophora immunda]KIW28938.1 hypothetical protein PV07_04790 [Cladophialophora immunda]